MFVPSVTSNISDWEWIAGGFPSRDVVRNRIISDSLNDLKRNNNTAKSRKAKNNIKDEILNESQDDELITSQCPSSIIPAEPIATSQETGPKDISAKTINEDPPVNFPAYEMVDSSDEAISTVQPPFNSGNEPPYVAQVEKRACRNFTVIAIIKVLSINLKKILALHQTPLSWITTSTKLLIRLTRKLLWRQ